jgi:hypothetical protein
MGMLNDGFAVGVSAVGTSAARWLGFVAGVSGTGEIGMTIAGFAVAANGVVTRARAGFGLAVPTKVAGTIAPPVRIG